MGRFLRLSCPPVRSLLALASIAALGAACAAGASTQSADRASFTPRSVASGFEQPIFVTGAKGEPGRLYVVEQGGEIGRPSTMRCRVEVDGGRAVRVTVAGSVVPVARGEVRAP